MPLLHCAAMAGTRFDSVVPLAGSMNVGRRRRVRFPGCALGTREERRMQVQKELRFYAYDQNNSGGEFNYDEQDGISVKVIVQAISHEDANARAKGIGLYFDGVDSGDDCPCCGDRWYEQWRERGMDLAALKQWFTDWTDSKWFRKWMRPEQAEVFVHFADGRVLGLVFGEPGNYQFAQSGGGLLALEN